jgi:hypothetical protein
MNGGGSWHITGSQWREEFVSTGSGSMGSFVGATNKVDNFEDSTWEDATVQNNEGTLDLTQDFVSKEAGIMGKMSCSNSVFGDPLPGIVKSCFCESDTSQEDTEIEVDGNPKSQITSIRF